MLITSMTLKMPRKLPMSNMAWNVHDAKVHLYAQDNHKQQLTCIERRKVR